MKYVLLHYSQYLLYELINLSVLLGRLVRVHLIKPVSFLFCLSGILCGWRLSSKTWDPITSSWMKHIDVAQNRPLWRRCIRLALCTTSGVCQKWRRQYLNFDLIDFCYSYSFCITWPSKVRVLQGADRLSHMGLIYDCFFPKFVKHFIRFLVDFV